MKKEIKRLLRRLQWEYAAMWVLPLLLIVLYETGVMTEGGYAGDVRAEYLMQTAGILLAVGLIPLSLRLFNLSMVNRIKRLPLPEALQSYRRWSEVRIILLLVPTLVNLSFYYQTMNTSGVWCAVITLLASLFCIPTHKRLLDELDLLDENGHPVL